MEQFEIAVRGAINCLEKRPAISVSSFPHRGDHADHRAKSISSALYQLHGI
jgi:hypothetical protein